MTLPKFEHLCLGHASIGAYSCFEEALEGIDSEGDGYCANHAAFIREEGNVICTKCAHIVWDDKEHHVGHWESENDCIRCKGSGKEELIK